MTRPRIGLFGGTFDPPHIGHLILASEALHVLRLSRLLWVLTPNPPHKRRRSLAPVEDRLAMLQLATEDDAAFEVSRLELDRPGPHFTLDTVRLSAAQEPGADVVLLLGGDSLRDLPHWHRPQDLIRACRLIGVMRRPGDSLDLSALERALPGITSKARFLPAPRLEISSSEIRRRIAKRIPFRYFLRHTVYDYIQQGNLYR